MASFVSIYGLSVVPGNIGVMTASSLVLRSHEAKALAKLNNGDKVPFHSSLFPTYMEPDRFAAASILSSIPNLVKYRR